MNVSFTSDEVSRLSELAQHSGVTVEQKVRDAVSRMLEEDRQFREAVQVGIEAADRGELIDHEDVWAHLESATRI